jgi:ABC-2 type transport system ATP-binding protein
VIEVEGLHRRFGRQAVYEGLDLSVGVGVLGLLGPNGAGKTTLMRILATVLRPNAGAVRILGLDVGRREGLAEVRRQLGYLPQSFGFYPSFTALEFIQYMAWLKQVDSSRLRERSLEALELAGVANQAGVRMRRLSGGQVRRVGIAQAIVNQPQVLLLDEPTAGLDPRQRVEFRRLLREIGLRATVIVSTHLVEDVVAACTRVAIIESGRILFDATPADLVALGQAQVDGGDTPVERGYVAVIESSGE